MDLLREDFRGAALRLSPLEAGGDLGELGWLAQRRQRVIEQLGLGLDKPGCVLQRAAGRFQRLGLAAQHLSALLD